jgi:hypothetical protein
LVQKVTELDPARLSLWTQVGHVVLKNGTKALLDNKLGRERDRTAVLKELDCKLRARGSGLV